MKKIKAILFSVICLLMIFPLVACNRSVESSMNAINKADINSNNYVNCAYTITNYEYDGEGKAIEIDERDIVLRDYKSGKTTKTILYYGIDYVDETKLDVEFWIWKQTTEGEETKYFAKKYENGLLVDTSDFTAIGGEAYTEMNDEAFTAIYDSIKHSLVDNKVPEKEEQIISGKTFMPKVANFDVVYTGEDGKVNFVKLSKFGTDRIGITYRLKEVRLNGTYDEATKKFKNPTQVIKYNLGDHNIPQPTVVE